MNKKGNHISINRLEIIWESCKAGDCNAQIDLYTYYSPKLIILAYAYLQNMGIAKMIVKKEITSIPNMEIDIIENLGKALMIAVKNSCEQFINHQ